MKTRRLTFAQAALFGIRKVIVLSADPVDMSKSDVHASSVSNLESVILKLTSLDDIGLGLAKIDLR